MDTQFDAVPALGQAEEHVLLAALERRPRPPTPYEAPWRSAGMREATGEDEPDAGYAFSPRSTRGATRA